MDREQEEMQFLGPIGILEESYKTIMSCRRVLSQITLFLILPLALLILIHIEVSDVVLNKIVNNEVDLSDAQVGSPKYDKLSDLVSSEWTFLILFKLAYFTFLLIFSLLSTSAVVYTIACVYTARDVSFKKVMSVVPKVWKRLMVTFLWTILAFFVYNVVATIFLFVAVLFIFSISYKAGLGFIAVFSVLYVVGFVYLSLVWQSASVVSVLEEARGIQAMNKSRALLKGKVWTAIFVYGILTLLSFGLQYAFQKLVVYGGRFGNLERVFYGMICLLVSVKLILSALVIQTVLYFVCKSYHHENIDKSALSDHLEVYLGEYVPLTAKDVQLEQYHV
ncbi:uncharacterized protein LOC21404694 [Morus notabilis]|nr:uncharacterized protein LOC21404694 [Morus notabilis]